MLFFLNYSKVFSHIVHTLWSLAKLLKSYNKIFSYTSKSLSVHIHHQLMPSFQPHFHIVSFALDIIVLWEPNTHLQLLTFVLYFTVAHSMHIWLRSIKQILTCGLVKYVYRVTQMSWLPLNPKVY